ncbi:hypothetical protein [Streptomyces sp. DH7]|uniref:hypothetical protein n=1 Tax=Streptomyces sp. DH7 TaxID=2857006 RepID=UPI001E594E1B|nr:hypothetical protein [Streptomyces sp. DH7]
MHWLVNELDIAVRDRTAGLLLLRFAQPLSRICALSRDDVLDDGTTLRLRLGTHPVEVPPPLDGMLRELVRHPVGKVHRLAPCPPRAVPPFPGRSADAAGQPVAQAQGARHPAAAPAHQERLAHGPGR